MLSSFLCLCIRQSANEVICGRAVWGWDCECYFINPFHCCYFNALTIWEIGLILHFLVEIAFCCLHLQWFWSSNHIQSGAEKDSRTDGLTFIFLIDFYLVLQQSSFWRLKGCCLAVCTLNVQLAGPWKIRSLWCRESVLAIKHLLSNH